MGEDETIDNPNNAEYSSKSDYSKAEVVRTQIIKCNQVRSQEMRDGYFNYDKFGNKIPIPDSRQEWVSSVKTLMFNLKPEIKRMNYRERIKKILDKEKDAVETWGIFPTSQTAYKIEYLTNLPKYIPRLDQLIPTEVSMIKRNGDGNGIFIDMKKGLCNNNFHNYWDELVKIYDEIFEELNELMDRCNYFKQKVAY